MVQKTDPPEEPSYDVIKQTVSIDCAHGMAEVFLTSKRIKTTQRWQHQTEMSQHYVLGQDQQTQDLVTDLCAFPNPHEENKPSRNQA